MKIKKISEIGAEPQYGIPADNEMTFESCVLCGKQTNVRRNTHIYSRAYYVEGCGQFCQQCFTSVYAIEEATEGNQKNARLVKTKEILEDGGRFDF